MFEGTISSSWDERSRRGYTTLFSFGIEALAVAALLMAPLLRLTAVPLIQQQATPISLGNSDPEHPAVAPRSAHSAPANISPVEIFLRQPSHIPNHVDKSADAAPTAPIAESGPYIPGIRGTPGPGGVFEAAGLGTAPVVPATPVHVERAIRLSHMAEGDLVHKVLPKYPPLARSARIQGTVVLQAMIGKSGTIENLRLLAGHPMLAPAAIDAVRQWRYRPYILNDEPVEVETQITVNFSLGN